MPCYYNQYDYWHGNKYIDVPSGSPYPFGFGLSYSKFAYSDATLSCSQAKCGESVTLTVNVTNQSEVGGAETVQLYFKDKVCKILTPIRTLLDFQKIYIPAGESRTVEFVIPIDKLGYYNNKCEYRVDTGEFLLFVTGDGIHFAEATLLVV
jgi:beta-glucosidase